MSISGVSFNYLWLVLNKTFINNTVLRCGSETEEWMIIIYSLLHAGGDGSGCFHDRDEKTKNTFYDMDNSQTILRGTKDP